MVFDWNFYLSEVLQHRSSALSYSNCHYYEPIASRNAMGMKTISYPGNLSLPTIPLRLKYFRIISSIEKVSPNKIKIILRETCGENNSNFKIDDYNNEFNDLKNDIPNGYKIVCYDEYGNLIEGEEDES